MNNQEPPDQPSENQPLRKAAIYVRMSTENQQFSIENQTAAMEFYAVSHNIEIVKTYTDGGKSGLNFSGRLGLQQLIADVKARTKEYTDILVLDLTRWGRFQDVDESAHYEYLCRSGGFKLHYVAEQFDNDGSVISSIIKNVKRVMAADYSRELSKKVFVGQCRLIEKGFRQGGHAGYGLRRRLIDENRQPKCELLRGQRKSFQTDRVILVPGPDEEVQNVRWIYMAFVQDGLNEVEIAARLNARGVLTDLGRSWTRSTVHQILINEKYIGNNIFNRKSFKLKERRTVNPEEKWVRAVGVFEAIVEPHYFLAAQHIIQARSRRVSDEEMLDKLKILQERSGWLSGVLIDETDGMPSSSVYASRFGGLTRAYELIGYDSGRDNSFIEENKRLREMHPGIMQDIRDKIYEFGGTVQQDGTSDFLIVNSELKVSVVICRCMQTSAGSSRWKIQFDASLMPDITIAVRMDPLNLHVFDYYVIPSIDVENPKLRLAEDNHFALDAYRFDDLQPFFALMKRAPLMEIA